MIKNKIILYLIIVIIISIALSHSKNSRDINFLIFNNKSEKLYQTHIEAQGFKFPIKIYRFGFLILKLFSLPIAILWTILYGHKYNNSFFNKINSLTKNPLAYPEFSYSLQTAIPWYKSKYAQYYDINDKIFWYNVFKNLNVPQPTLYAIIENGKITKQIKKFNGEMIFKPSNGGWGRGIRLFNNEEIPSIKEKTLVQERIKNEINNSYFRIITTKDKMIQIFYYFTNDKNPLSVNTISTKSSSKNYLNFETLEIINPSNEQIINKLDHKFKNTLNNAIKDAIKITDYLQYPIVVSFDVITRGNNHYFLEGNVPGGAYTKKYKNYFNLIKNIETLIK